MTQSSWPFQGVDTTETQYSRLLRNIGQGVSGVPGDNNLLVYANSSGMNVKVKVSGGNSQAIVRGHMYLSTAEETLSISPAATSPRIDSVVLRLDPSANSIVLAVVTGTPGVSPSAPSLTQTDTGVYELLLANVLIPASASSITASNVTDKRTFLGDVWTTETRPVGTVGRTGYNTTTNKLESYSTSGSWVEVTPTSLNASVISSGTIDPARLATVAVNKGGTGATDANSARTNLGITPGNIGAALQTHTHVISDVTSLQSSLDGKAPTNHNHDYRNITVDGGPNIIEWTNGSYVKAANGNHNGLLTLSNGGGACLTANNQIFTSGIFRTTSDLWADGQVRGDSGLRSSGVYNTSVTYGAYRAVWVNSDGTLGQTASSKTVKQDIEPTDLNVDAILDAEVVNFRYIDAVEALAEKAPIEIGVIAEQLLEIGLEKFVYFNEDGSPAGVHYERLAVAIIPQLQKQAAQIADIELRLSALEA